MIVSMHVTYVTAGGTAGLNDVVSVLDKTVPGQIAQMEGVNEYVIVRTCNRFELYTACDDNLRVRTNLESLIKSIVPSSNISYILEDTESIKHLFRVVCGLDSMIVGEDQIQHQVKESFMKARGEGHVNGLLSRLFDKAMIVGKRVRSETALNKGAVSVGSAAVELAESRIGNLSGTAITIMGAGDMASVISKNLIGKDIATVIVSNRTYSHALELANELGGTAVSMERLIDAISVSDLVLVATGAPHTVLHKNVIAESMASRPDRPLLVIDVSMPHNVDEDITDIQNVMLDNMDSLETIAKHNVELRTKEINSAEKIIAQELQKLDRERKEEAANEIIRLISQKVSDIRERELDIAVSRGRSVDRDEVLNDLSRATVNKLMADVYANLRKASREGDLAICEAVARIFGVRDSE